MAATLRVALANCQAEPVYGVRFKFCVSKRQGDTNRHARMTEFVPGGRSIGDRSALRPVTGGAQNPSMESPCDSCDKTLMAGRLSLITVRKYCFECPHGYVPSRFNTLTVTGDIRSCRRILASVATPANSETPPPVLAGA